MKQRVEYSAVLGVEPTVHQQYHCLPCSLVNVLVQRCLLFLAALVSMGSVVIVSNFVVGDLLV